MRSPKIAKYPDTPFNPSYKQYLQTFFTDIDKPDPEDWKGLFTPDATVIMGAKKLAGENEIFACNTTVLNECQRVHRVNQVFPFGLNSDSAMVTGVLELVYPEGRDSTDFAAYCHMKDVDGAVKMDFCQVYFGC
ncbi:hypothetical protein ASPWEDRAFT_65102 [Aspergillus wentii DTO 134E9]|uniref:SnoaL-like domain-containing protein n=1 Tax=Aspergillus wentii DTO 134E9 TaxID=1073089 RepID=A0A1L9S466_ASPWE|nr:uncharacterized protein ASPWEDRAFT_65102 [Aspergillus wentii DTO 134E9]OJJ41933.1 hypothetical protein ASPWEDRAFT_65102 [Aspergillus wentii DTO 134E9]